MLSFVSFDAHGVTGSKVDAFAPVIQTPIEGRLIPSVKRHIGRLCHRERNRAVFISSYLHVLLRSAVAFTVLIEANRSL